MWKPCHHRPERAVVQGEWATFSIAPASTEQLANYPPGQYEHDIATAIREIFGDELDLEEDFDLSPFPITREAFATGAPRERSMSRKQTSAEWYKRAAFRKEQIDKYLWNEGQALYFDYDTKKKRQSRYESVTAFWGLWAGCASEHQAERLV